ncbi:hypothetical protein [Amycolatopsis magusensis]|uniref:Uncharacterized protein n=1 Tax=Amycolatopsis magusensis TaxID=882444 RepID=A0ABS4Q082_9PSEU|nr:hypothetical protein [Amycolatopsis magusensis]MBP2184993.1 hypothetical protein [Amycolatopsis magusensis]MDI5979800.1 hypothetical protein [Amycolatopsis magusensis]
MQAHDRRTRTAVRVVYLGQSAAMRELADWAARHGVLAADTVDEGVICGVIDQDLLHSDDPLLHGLREKHLPCLTVSRGWCFLASAIGQGVRPVA